MLNVSYPPPPPLQNQMCAVTGIFKKIKIHPSALQDTSTYRKHLMPQSFDKRKLTILMQSYLQPVFKITASQTPLKIMLTTLHNVQ